MADISITHVHQLTHTNAKAAAQQVADQIAAEYDMASEWNGDVLLFQRAGVSGSLTVNDQHATLEITLGFLFKAFAPAIEQKVGAKMTKVFAAAA
jgi:putative polyhydroxyalkanoate system protein